ncbi:unnamed protein product [Urochloa humidicola]
MALRVDPAVAALPVPVAAAGNVLGGVTDYEYVNSDSEFEDDNDDGQAPPPDVVAHGGEDRKYIVPPVAVRFLGRSVRFASVYSTGVFMSIVPAAAAPDGENAGSGGGEIVVHYRYTRFFAAQGGGDGVGTHFLGPKLARVRFHLPAHAADPVTTLELAGAALAPIVYPARFSAELGAMWSWLVAEWPVPRATPTTRIVVTVEVGILRPGDLTSERMCSMYDAMEEYMALERYLRPAAVFHVDSELLLPAPLVKEEDVRPAKRRRVAGEDCPICYEALEEGLAAWPRCLHVFHARCLEEHLVRGHQECPMCRSGLGVDAQQASTE